MNGLIDYAGLFPPAALDMETAVANYARYLRGEHGWALGRFVVPVARLENFRTAQGALISPDTTKTILSTLAFGLEGFADSLHSASRGVAEHFPWRLSAIVSADLESELKIVKAFNSKNSGRSLIDSVEIKASTIDEIRRAAPLVPQGVTCFFEIPANAGSEIFHMLHGVGARAKIRTGGVVESAFPAAELIAQFIVRCAEAKVAFKATAGLHHPLRCVKPLTYAANAPTGTMHGFLNVFLAACVCGGLGTQIDEAQRAQVRAAMIAILMSDTAGSFEFRGDRAIMRGMLRESANGIVKNSNYELSVSTEIILRARSNFAISFGSCSFEEPIEDLRNLHLL